MMDGLHPAEIFIEWLGYGSANSTFLKSFPSGYNIQPE